MKPQQQSQQSFTILPYPKSLLLQNMAIYTYEFNCERITQYVMILNVFPVYVGKRAEPIVVFTDNSGEIHQDVGSKFKFLRNVDKETVDKYMGEEPKKEIINKVEEIKDNVNET